MSKYNSEIKQNVYLSAFLLVLTLIFMVIWAITQQSQAWNFGVLFMIVACFSFAFSLSYRIKKLEENKNGD